MARDGRRWMRAVSGPTPQAGLRRQLALHVPPAPGAAARCRPRSRLARRAPTPGPAGCPGWRRPACGSARTASAGRARRSRVWRAGRATQFRAALEHALGDFPEGVQVSAQQEHGLGGSRPRSVRNSLARLPMRCVSITRWPMAEIRWMRALLQLERRHGFGDVQQIGGLAVDGAQGLAHLGQDGLLDRTTAQRSVRPLDLAAAGGRGRPAVRGAQAAGRRLHRPLASDARARQHLGAVAHLREGAAIPSGPATPTCDPLRLHQGLTGGGHLLRDLCPPGVTAKTATAPSTTKRQGQQREQHPLVRRRWCAARAPAPRSVPPRRPASSGVIESSCAIAVGLGRHHGHRAAARRCRPAGSRHRGAAMRRARPGSARRWSRTDRPRRALSCRTGSSVKRRRTWCAFGEV